MLRSKIYQGRSLRERSDILQVIEGIWLQLSRGCAFFTRTGWYCPGCGGTRAIRALLQGRILMSIYYHPAIFYLGMLFGIWILRYAVETFLPSCGIVKMPYKNIYVYLGCAILCANWVLKNVLLHLFGMVMI